ncbi:ABC transporter substrate-binding protein [Aminobacter sp. LjRoot7]|uniref:ABC transporter substrate-binding protein n=1 Tax=Aminobacter sp. LjRoot7 TaxID=3342335 RepID=UPI003ED04FA1
MLLLSKIRKIGLGVGSALLMATSSAFAAETLTFYDLESLSGPGQTNGIAQANAVKLAVDAINKAGGLKVGDTTYEIELDVHDDRSAATSGVTAVQKMLSYGKPVLMVGSLSGAVTGAYAPIVRDRDDVISVVLGAAITITEKDKSLYHPRVAVAQYTTSTVKYIASLGNIKRVGILTDHKHSGFVQQTPVLEELLTKQGMEVVGKEDFSFGATQFGPQITALVRGNPDIINIRGYGGDVARAIKQARDLGFTGPIVSSSGTVAKDVIDAQAEASMANVRDLFVPLANDLIEGGRNADKAKAFEEAYRAAYDDASGATSLSAYGGVFVLARALEKAGTVTNILAIRKVLDDLKVSDVPEIIEPMIPQDDGRIFKNHQSYFALVVREWKDGRFVPVGFVE